MERITSNKAHSFQVIFNTAAARPIDHLLQGSVALWPIINYLLSQLNESGAGRRLCFWVIAAYCVTMQASESVLRA